MVSKAPLRGLYQRKFEEMAALPEVEQLTLIVPPYWKEPRVGKLHLEKTYTQGYDLIVEPMAFNGQYHLHYYPGLEKWVQQLRPDIFHVDEESFNLSTAQGVRLAEKYNARAVFYNYANIYRKLPPPFNWLEKYNFAHAAGGIACNQEAADILRRKGFGKPLAIFPQFGVDPAITHRTEPPAGFARPDLFTIGYVGRLVPEKGLPTLLEAASSLKGPYRVVLIGDGSQRDELQALAERIKIAAQVEFIPNVKSLEVPAYMSGLDVLVLPSLTMPNWKEQFGRVLTEAMACQVPVIGSSSGEIPHVIGEAGLVFPEGDAPALTARLQTLLDNPSLRVDLAAKGLARVQASYTQAQIARRHVEFYQQVGGGKKQVVGR